MAKRRRNIIRIHEKVIATKHGFSKITLVLICIVILFLLTWLCESLVNKYTETYIKGAIIVIYVLVLCLLYFLVIAQYLYMRNIPYKRIIYDTKYKWFRVYIRRYYHLIRPTDIVDIKIASLYRYQEDEEIKTYGVVKIKIINYGSTSERDLFKTLTLHCSNPAEAKKMIDDLIEEKLQSDYQRVEKTRRIAQIERLRIKYVQPYEKENGYRLPELEKEKIIKPEHITSFNPWD